MSKKKKSNVKNSNVSNNTSKTPVKSGAPVLSDAEVKNGLEEGKTASTDTSSLEHLRTKYELSVKLSNMYVDSNLRLRHYKQEKDVVLESDAIIGVKNTQVDTAASLDMPSISAGYVFGVKSGENYRPHIGVLNAFIQRGSGELNDNTEGEFVMRKRLPITDVHYIRPTVPVSVGASEFNLNHPAALAVLADDVQREALFEQIASQQFIKKVAKFAVGPTGRFKKGGSGRFSFTQLFSFISKELGKTPLTLTDFSSLTSVEISQNEYAAFVVTQIFFEALKPFELHFNLNDVYHVVTAQERIMNLDDIRKVAREGQVINRIPSGTGWVDTKYAQQFQKAFEIYTSAVEESLGSSLLQFRAKLGSLSLFNIEFDAVLSCAKMALANRLGIKLHFTDFAVHKGVMESGAISMMSQWYAVATDVLKGGTWDESTFATYYARGFSASVLLSAAEELISAIEKHPSIVRVSAQDVIKSYHIENTFVSNAGYHCFTSISRLDDRTGTSFIFNEFEVGMGLSRPVVNERATTLISQAAPVATLVRNFTKSHAYSHEFAPGIFTSGLEGVGGQELINKAKAQLCLINCDPEELRLLNLLTYDLMIGYQVDKEGMSVVKWNYAIPRRRDSVLTALSVVDSDLHTSSDFVALFMQTSKNGVAMANNGDASRSLSSRQYNGRFYITPWNKLPEVSALTQTLTGTVVVNTHQGSENIKYSLDMNKVMHVPATLTSYQYHDYQSQLINRMFECFVYRAIDLSKVKVSSGLSVDQQAVELCLANLTRAYLEEVKGSPLFDSVRRTAMDEVARQLSQSNLVSWANWVHNFKLKSSVTTFAMIQLLRLAGIEVTILNQYKQALSNSGIARLLIETMQFDDAWIALNQG